jgi:hypothetical protein
MGRPDEQATRHCTRAQDSYSLRDFGVARRLQNGVGPVDWLTQPSLGEQASVRLLPGDARDGRDAQRYSNLMVP